MSFERIKGNNYDIVTEYSIKQCFLCGKVEKKSCGQHRDQHQPERKYGGSPSRFGT